MTDIKLDYLRQRVMCMMTDFRFSHTLGVERMVTFIGEKIMPENVYNLQIAALLHDITKEMPITEQLYFLKKEGVKISYDDRSSEKTLHQTSGAIMAGKAFSEYMTPEILNAIACHSTGRTNMTVFDEILFLSDYIEDTRKHSVCVQTREKFMREFENSSARKHLSILHKFCLECLNNTISNLVQNNQFIHSSSLNARKFLIEKLNNTAQE